MRVLKKTFLNSLELFIWVRETLSGVWLHPGCRRRLKCWYPSHHRGATDLCQQQRKSFFLSPKTNLETQLNTHLSPAHSGAAAEHPTPDGRGTGLGRQKCAPPRHCLYYPWEAVCLASHFLWQGSEYPLEGCGSWISLQSGNSWLVPHTHSPLPVILWMFPTTGIVLPNGGGGGEQPLVPTGREGQPSWVIGDTHVWVPNAASPSPPLAQCPALLPAGFSGCLLWQSPIYLACWSINSRWIVSKGQALGSGPWTSLPTLSVALWSWHLTPTPTAFSQAGMDLYSCSGQNSQSLI